MKSLKEGDLSTPNGILDCTAASYQLQRCVRADIHPGKNTKYVKYLKEGDLSTPNGIQLNLF